MFSQHQRTAIVTGGGSGIGRAIADRFVGEGIRTIIIGRNEARLKETAEALGPLCIPHSFDLNNLDEIPNLAASLFKKYGEIDILVNNAGINLKKDFCAVTNEEFQNILHTNVTAVFALTREIAVQMVRQERGSIIMISSMASQYGIPKVIAYTASKSAVEGMTRALAVEVSPNGVRVNCIAPGFIATEMSSAALDSDPERRQKVLSRTPMGKLGQPADVAEAACFFASDASRFITGTVLPVDGGNAIGF